ncbi:MAG: AEC family transporter [Clostridia bacterium]|nr:AEC family transporter [Clostridia bacterium]
MESLLIMLKNVVMFVLLALPGYILVKTRLLNAEHTGALSKLLMFVGMPFLILSSTLKLSLSAEFVKMMLLVAGIGVAFILVAFFASALLTKGEKNEKTRGMMRFSAVFANNGFLGLPLAIAVFGADSQAVAVVIVLNIITNILMFTLGVYLVSGDKETMNFKKAFLNPVLIAFVIGIILNLLKITAFVPEVATYSAHFNNIVTPLSMTVLGMKMGGIKFSKLFTNVKTYYVSAIKLILFPVVIVGLLLLIRLFAAEALNADILIGIFVAFAVPTAGLASTFADQLGGDTESAVSFTLGSTLLSIITIPVLYWVLNLII